MLADDTNVFLREKSFVNLLAKSNAELLNIDTCLASINKLSLNIGKTTFCFLKKSHYYQKKPTIKLIPKDKFIKQVI